MEKPMEDLSGWVEVEGTRGRDKERGNSRRYDILFPRHTERMRIFLHATGKYPILLK